MSANALRNLLEHLVELRLRLKFDLANRFEQRFARFRQIVELRPQERLALGDFVALGFGVEIHVGGETAELFAQTRQVVDDRIGLVAVARFDVAALVVGCRILRELRDEHAELGFDFGHPHALALAAAGGFALFHFGHADVGLQLRLAIDQRLALATSSVERGIEIADAAAQPFDVRVRCARLVCERPDLRQHLFARDARALAVLIEHAETRSRRVAFGRKRCGTLAQFGRVRSGRRLRFFGGCDVLARLSQFGFEPLAFGVAAELLGFGAFETALVHACFPCVGDQFFDQRANLRQLRRESFFLGGQRRRLRTRPSEPQFDL